jgi:hypothetical protein
MEEKSIGKDKRNRRKKEKRILEKGKVKKIEMRNILKKK